MIERRWWPCVFASTNRAAAGGTVVEFLLLTSMVANVVLVAWLSQSSNGGGGLRLSGSLCPPCAVLVATDKSALRDNIGTTTAAPSNGADVNETKGGLLSIKPPSTVPLAGTAIDEGDSARSPVAEDRDRITEVPGWWAQGPLSRTVSASASPWIRFDADLERQRSVPEPNKSRFSRSPVPNGKGMLVRVDGERWIPFDDIAFGYDVWFESTRSYFYQSWLGASCQQDPSDAWMIQEMIFRVKPDVVVEVGTNTGGGAIFYASIMRAYTDHPHVVTLDIKQAGLDWGYKAAAMACPHCISGPRHPLWKHVTFIKGKIGTLAIQEQVRKAIEGPAPTEVAPAAAAGGPVEGGTSSSSAGWWRKGGHRRRVVLAIEDGNHAYADTLGNSRALAQFVTKGSYLLIQDTKLDRFLTSLMNFSAGTKWGPMAAVEDFLLSAEGKAFRSDRGMERFGLSQHHRGYLKRVAEAPQLTQHPLPRSDTP